MRLLFGKGGYHLAVDDDMCGMSGGFQGVTIEEGEVGVVAFLEGADFLIEAEDLSGVESASGEGDFLRKSVGGGEGGFEVDHAGFGNVFFVAGLEGERDAFFVELGGEGEGHVFEVAVGAGHGGVNDDGNTGRFDFIEEEVGLGSAIEDEIEAKFFAKAKGGGDVLMTVGVDEERSLFVQNIDEGLQLDVAGRGVFFGIIIGFGNLGGVGPGFEEFGAEEGDRFGAGARGFAESFLSESGGDGGGGSEGVLDRGDGGDVGFDDHELAGDERSGRVAGVEGGNAEITDPLYERIASVVGIDGAEFGLDGSGFIELFLVVLGGVENAGKSYGSVGVDDAGSGDFGSDGMIAGRDFEVAADSLDFPVGSAEDDGILDRLEVAGHGEEEIGFDCDLGVGSRCGQKEDKRFDHDEKKVGLTIEAAASGFAVVSGAVAALGEESVLLVGEGEDFSAFDVGFEDAGVDGEGIAREHDEVGLLTGCERASGFVEIEHFGSGESEAFKGFFAGHAGADADGCIAEEPAGVVDGVIGVESREDAAFFELGSVFPFEVSGLEFTAG